MKLLTAATVVLALAGGSVATAAPAVADDFPEWDTPPPLVQEFGTSRSEFYPTVRDGWKDDVGFDVATAYVEEQSDGGDVYQNAETYRVDVRNRNGALVATRTFRARDHDSGSWYGEWTWGGKDRRNGRYVGPGRYTATLTVTNDEGETGTARANVWARSDSVSRRLHRSRAGYYWSSRTMRSGCYLWDDEWSETSRIDCWGGRYGELRYRFAVPSNARNVDWEVRGSRGCCHPGRVARTGVRVDRTHYVVKVRVTNWRSYTVRRVNLDYTAPVRR